MVQFIPPETIQEIMQKADIVEIVGEYVMLKKQGRNWFGLCPFHDEDTASFSVNQDKQIYKCFGCGKGGNVIGFIQEVEHLSFVEAAEKLADRYGIDIPQQALSQEEQKRQQQRQSLLKIHDLAASFYAKQLSSSNLANTYLKKRGISPETAAKFDLGYAPEQDWQALSNYLSQQGYSEQLQVLSGLVSRSAKNGRCYDKFHGRLIFPIRDHRGQTVAFGGRSLGDEQPKYLNSQTTPIYNKSLVLFALNLAAADIQNKKQAIIMEGYMDVLTAHQNGITNAVASLGTAFTSEQAKLLNRYAPEAPQRMEVLLAFDGDQAGAKAALASLDKLSEFAYAVPKVIMFPKDKDPDDFLREDGIAGWEQLYHTATYPLLDYLLLKAKERHDINSAAGKGSIVADLLPALRKCRNNTERDSFIRQLSRDIHVSEQAIRADLGQKHGSRTEKNQKNITNKISPKAESSSKPANRQLLIYSLYDKNIFLKAKSVLGENFASNEEEDQLISLIDQVKDIYDFNPSSLFNYLSEENEGLRHFLLKLIQAKVPEENRSLLADAFIKTIQEQQIKEQLKQIQQQISQAEDNAEDFTDLIQEKLRLKKLLSH